LNGGSIKSSFGGWKLVGDTKWNILIFVFLEINSAFSRIKKTNAYGRNRIIKLQYIFIEYCRANIPSIVTL